ncbi:MAG TPA: c-type cytochrome [Gaiellaceae bacterium]|nr:c-type cytochrome [Gaiellaceae bacterium]
MSLVAITSNGKIGLGLAALVFIVFALVSSFVLPRRNPDFPGNRLGAYIAVSTLLFLAMVAAVVVFAKEGGEEAEGAEATETIGEQPTLTETGPETETTGTGGEGGEAAAGEAVYSSAGCGGCHTLEAAGSSGNIGPNLDETKPSLELIVDRVTNGAGAMPSFKEQLDEAQIQNVSAYVLQSTQG